MRLLRLLCVLVAGAAGVVPVHSATVCDKGPIPSILIFDIDASSLKPASDTAAAEFIDLHKASLGFFNGLKESQDAACMRVVDLGWIPEMDAGVLGSHYYEGLPADDMWMGTDYSAHGKITKDPGGKYTLTVNLVDSQTFDVVDERQLSFDKASDAIDAGQQLAKSMSPLLPVIRDYQRRLRDKAGDTAIDAIIRISSAKAKINVGEKLDITLSMVDFDGTPLKNRKVTLTGDDSASVSADKVTTDDSGNVMFQVVGKQLGLSTITASYEYLNAMHKVVTAYGRAAFQVGTPPPNTWEMVLTATRHITKSQQKEPPRATSGDSSAGREDSVAYVTAWFEGPSASDLKQRKVKFLKPIAYSGGGDFDSILTHRTWSIDSTHKTVSNVDNIQKGILDIPKYFDLSFQGEDEKATLSFSVTYRCTYEDDTNVLDSAKKNYHLNSSLPAYVNTFMFSPYLGGSSGHMALSDYASKNFHFQWAGNDSQGDGGTSPLTTTDMTINATLHPLNQPIRVNKPIVKKAVLKQPVKKQPAKAPAKTLKPKA